MNRIKACLLILLLCLAAGAQAQSLDDYWTCSDDLYYHFNERCGAGEGRVPISTEAAKAFGKGVCPVCFPIDNDVLEAPQGVSRGGTIVVCFTDGFLGGQELSGVFGFMGQSSYAGADAHRMLMQYLHGADYNAFLDAWLSGAAAEGRANTPSILPADGGVILSRRHIGDRWYIILRPGEKFGRNWNMYWRVSSLALWMEGDVLRTEFDLQTVEETYPITLQAMNGAQPVCSRNSGGIAIEVYQALDGNIAVIREENAGAELLENVQLRIAGRDGGIDLTGYMDGAAAVYCCMLTDAELAALQGNARMELWHTEPVNNAVYRVNGETAFDYYSKTTAEKLFTVERVNGADPVDDDFRFILGGIPDCFVVNGGDGPAAYRYTQTGREAISMEAGEGLVPQRITPLIWHDNGGVFLAEYYKDPARVPEGLLFANGMEFGVRFGSAPEDEWASYRCWLVDENGEVINHANNQAFTVLESGEIILEDFEGNTWSYVPGDD